MKHALILAPFDDEGLTTLRKDVRVTYESWLDSQELQDPEVLGRRLHDDAVNFLVVEGDFVFAEVMEEAPELELIGVCRNALNHVDVDAATERGILVVNVPGRNAIAVAELTLGVMLALARRIPQADVYVKAGRWEDPVSGYREFRGGELHGKQAGIVGLGAIGRMVAERLRALGMTVVAHDPYLSPEAAASLGVEMADLNEVLARSDYLLLHVPADESTIGMIAKAELASMKPTAYLINTSAPGVVAEDDLIEALASRVIAGAALDVFEGQPLPESSPLRRMDNVVLTPHIGGSTRETIARQSAMIAEDIGRAPRGQRPVRLVNPDAWAARRGS